MITQIFAVGFAMFGMYGLGQYEFPTKVSACRFVNAVEDKYQTRTFQFAIYRRVGGKMIEKWSKDPGDGYQHIDCHAVVEEHEKPERKRRLLGEIDKIYLKSPDANPPSVCGVSMEVCDEIHKNVRHPQVKK